MLMGVTILVNADGVTILDNAAKKLITVDCITVQFVASCYIDRQWLGVTVDCITLQFVASCYIDR